MSDNPKITPRLLVWAYSHGVFPMARGRQGSVQWYAPDPRAILPLASFHTPKTLRRRVRQKPFCITFDQAFGQVIRACARPRSSDADTWISEEIIHAYTALHRMGLAHSVEAWTEFPPPPGSRPVGGLYGVALGGAFFGESMFHTATDASKVCLVHLVERLQRGEYQLLDTQFANPHLQQFGLQEVSNAQYLLMLTAALEHNANWEITGPSPQR